MVGMWLRALAAVVLAFGSQPAACEPLRWLALGDSYTIGEGVEEAGRWPLQLAQGLRARGIEIESPRIIATTGWTTDELSAAMDQAEPLGRWDLVSLLIGVNNQYRGRPVDNFRGEFERLLQRAIRLAGRRERVFVLTIPDWGVTAFAADRDRARIAAELDAHNAVIREVCAAQAVAVVDIAPASRARGGEPAMQAADGLHPSATLYGLWSAQALPVVSGLLERSAD